MPLDSRAQLYFMVHNYSVINVSHAIVHGYNAQVLVTATNFNRLDNLLSFLGQSKGEATL